MKKRAIGISVAAAFALGAIAGPASAGAPDKTLGEYGNFADAACRGQVHAYYAKDAQPLGQALKAAVLGPRKGAVANAAADDLCVTLLAPAP